MADTQYQSQKFKSSISFPFSTNLFYLSTIIFKSSLFLTVSMFLMRSFLLVLLLMSPVAPRLLFLIELISSKSKFNCYPLKTSTSYSSRVWTQFLNISVAFCFKSLVKFEQTLISPFSLSMAVLLDFTQSLVSLRRRERLLQQFFSKFQKVSSKLPISSSILSRSCANPFLVCVFSYLTVCISPCKMCISLFKLSILFLRFYVSYKSMVLLLNLLLVSYGKLVQFDAGIPSFCLSGALLGRSKSQRKLTLILVRLSMVLLELNSFRTDYLDWTCCMLMALDLEAWRLAKLFYPGAYPAFDAEYFQGEEVLRCKEKEGPCFDALTGRVCDFLKISGSELWFMVTMIGNKLNKINQIQTI